MFFKKTFSFLLITTHFGFAADMGKQDVIALLVSEFSHLSLTDAETLYLDHGGNYTEIWTHLNQQIILPYPQLTPNLTPQREQLERQMGEIDFSISCLTKQLEDFQLRFASLQEDLLGKEKKQQLLVLDIQARENLLAEKELSKINLTKVCQLVKGLDIEHQEELENLKKNTELLGSYQIQLAEHEKSYGPLNIETEIPSVETSMEENTRKVMALYRTLHRRKFLLTECQKFQDLVEHHQYNIEQNRKQYSHVSEQLSDLLNERKRLGFDLNENNQAEKIQISSMKNIVGTLNFEMEIIRDDLKSINTMLENIPIQIHDFLDQRVLYSLQLKEL